MTSVATLILKLNQLTKQSEFYLSRYLGALIHLPHVWRNLHAELHLTALTTTILHLTHQLNVSSLIRIGTPPLLKLTVQTPELETADELQPAPATLPLDMTKLQKPLATLRARALRLPKPYQAITRTLFQIGSEAQPTLPDQNYLATESGASERTSRILSPIDQARIYLPLKDETTEEESLRENVVERWLQQQEETGRKPMMSFVEAHQLYRVMFEEFVATSVLPLNMLAERFQETPHNLTLEQARTDLRVRLKASREDERVTLETRAAKQLPSILLPSYIPSSLWAKGSLAFGSELQSSSPSILTLTTNTSEASSNLTPTIFSEVTEREQTTSPQVMESNAAPDRIYQGTADQVSQRESTDFTPETNKINTHPIRTLAEEEPTTESILPEAELESDASLSEDRSLITSSDHSKQQIHVFSPATALYSTLAAHTTTAFISPTQGNGHTTPTTTLHTALKPPFAIDRLPQTLAYPDTSHLPSQTGKSVIDKVERILPVVESHPTPLYLRPPMNLPAVASITPQRTPETTLPSPNVSSTRERKSMLESEEEEADENEETSERHPEIEEEAEDAAMREQVRRMGKLIAEEARRHIGSD